jgi:hypothetical protein
LWEISDDNQGYGAVGRIADALLERANAAGKPASG